MLFHARVALCRVLGQMTLIRNGDLAIWESVGGSRKWSLKSREYELDIDG